MNTGIGNLASEPIGPVCPLTVRTASMTQRWDRLTFLHWAYEPSVVQSLLPLGLTVQTFDGAAWVGLVPFYMVVRPGRGPAVPWLSRFCETNVRTYVTAADGTFGVWFFSLDAARLPAVVAGRVGYRLPYFWSSMTIEETGPNIHYTCDRRWPHTPQLHAEHTSEAVSGSDARSNVEVVRGEQIAPDELTDREHFLSARWRLYSHGPKGIKTAVAWHEPWVLHRATVVTVDDTLVTAAGLPRATEAPIVHYSPGVDVRIGFPHRVSG